MSQADAIQEVPDIDGDFPPRLTRTLIGHDRAMREFLDAAKGGRMPHAWLLCGPQGVGKASFAYLAARALLSHAQPAQITALSPAPDSDAARLMENGVHPDLYVLKRGYNEKTEKFRGDISVEETVAMKKSFGLTASQGGWRVSIIDAIDEMNKYSVNALLKLIEEPPEKCLFLIVCHHPGRVLDTIRSRCRQLHFNALGEDDLQQIIAGKLDAVDPNEAAAAAFLADGSAGRALALSENGGFDLYREMVGVMEGLPQLDIERLHGLAGRFGTRAAPESFSLFCYLLSGWLHRYTRALATGEAFQPVFEGEAELAARLMGGQLPLEPAVSLWEKLQQQARSVEALNLDKKQAVLEWLGELADASRA
jgi:DNA polymerase-3 subunit delta'